MSCYGDGKPRFSSSPVCGGSSFSDAGTGEGFRAGDGGAGGGGPGAGYSAAGAGRSGNKRVPSISFY